MKNFIFVFIISVLSYTAFAQSKSEKAYMQLSYKIKPDHGADSFDKNGVDGMIYDIHIAKDYEDYLTMIIYRSDSISDACYMAWDCVFKSVANTETITTKYLTFTKSISYWQNTTQGYMTGTVWQYTARHNNNWYWIYFFNRYALNVEQINNYQQTIEAIIQSIKPLKK